MLSVSYFLEGKSVVQMTSISLGSGDRPRKRYLNMICQHAAWEPAKERSGPAVVELGCFGGQGSEGDT